MDGETFEKNIFHGFGACVVGKVRTHKHSPPVVPEQGDNKAGKVILSISLVLMSACLHRAPWKRSVGSCSTAKGASSAEVNPTSTSLFYYVALLSTPGREHSRSDTTRLDKRAARQTRRNTPFACCQRVAHITWNRADTRCFPFPVLKSLHTFLPDEPLYVMCGCIFICDVNVQSTWQNIDFVM